MKNVKIKLPLFVTLLMISSCLFSQAQKSVTEKFNVSRKQCTVFAYELENYLKSKGLYDGVQSRITISNTLDRIKRKMKIGGVDFTANHVFIVELLGGKIYDNGDWQEGFGIIEVGFETEAEAKAVYEKAKMTCKKYTMNIPIYCPPFRCVQVGKSVLFVYSINVNMDEYRDMAETWQPKKK